MTLADILNFPPGENKVAALAAYGLFCDGGHHKQWILEQVLIALGENLKEQRKVLEESDPEYGAWEPGIAP